MGELRRLVEAAVASFALVICLPLLVGIAVFLWVLQGRPVLFRQERIGKREVPFRLVKFRTMSEARGPDGELLSDDERISSIGRILRRSSLDELPELWNVVTGAMALVGPRPLPTRYLPRFLPAERRRHEVRPGLTGWAQVNGRNAIGWNQRLALDVWYVDHRSWMLDFKIILKTFALVIQGIGVSGEGTATMTELRLPK